MGLKRRFILGLHRLLVKLRLVKHPWRGQEQPDSEDSGETEGT